MMFQWLERLVYGPVGECDIRLPELTWSNPQKSWLDEYRESEAQLQALFDIHDPGRSRRRKKQQLEQELKDAEWILEYERNLAKLQEQVAEETNRTGVRGRSPERLRRLQSHLHGVRRSITL